MVGREVEGWEGGRGWEITMIPVERKTRSFTTHQGQEAGSIVQLTTKEACFGNIACRDKV